MTDPTRRAFLGLAQKAVAAAAVGVIAVNFIEKAEAMPAVPAPGGTGTPPDLTTQVQWGPPHHHRPPHHRPPHHRPPRRRRRWVCWWQRGRRICGWR